MVKSLFQKSKSILYSRQANILSAAAIILAMVALSRFLGLVRSRVFVHFFDPEELVTFLAAFQLPDLIFEILVLGSMSSAFIPVFSRYLGQRRDKEAWYVAGVTLNILVVFFVALSLLVFAFAGPVYSLVARGFTDTQISQTVFFARLLLLAQLFFVFSYVLTAALESNQRFLASAAAPLFYNLGIIAVTILFAGKLGLLAPVLGVLVGSVLHLLVQLPLAVSLGFRPIFALDFGNEGVRSIARLALPRVLELSFLQVKRLSDLFMASLILGGLTYYRFADALASLPVGLFGLSIAKASLPQLAKRSGARDIEKFKSTLAASFKEILFLVVPVSVFLAVLRVPLVRLAFGAERFDWQDTVQTGYALSAFALGAFAYALTLLVSRAFYACHDTVTPLKVSVFTVLVNVGLGLFFILGLKLPIWGLALSYSIAGVVQALVLFGLIRRKVGSFSKHRVENAFLKIVIASGVAGFIMFVLLKIFDRSAWDKNLSFLGELGLALPTTFDKFVLDTRYTVNLVLLTVFVLIVGLFVYVFLAYLLRVEELGVVARALRRIVVRGLSKPSKSQVEGEETITPTHINGS